jgi:UDP-GlcNAc3NAcA epimerase
MKVITIVGARPQFIKSAPVSKLLQSNGYQEYVIHTGQHYDSDMSTVFFKEMGLPKPYATLNCGNLKRDDMLSRMKNELKPIFDSIQPDIALVYGDTNSTLAGARMAKECKVPLVHIEAGLRSYNDEMPEEHNRIESDHIAKWLFTPTQQATENLRREGFNGRVIEQVGDVMLDALQMFQSSAVHTEKMGPISFFQKPFALATMHRFENISRPERLAFIVDQLNTFNDTVMPVWMPLHPATAVRLKEFGLNLTVHVAPPVGYLEMLWALKQTSLVLTDSGGLQKEAYYSDKPSVTLRGETEWVELIEMGASVLFDPSKKELLAPKARNILSAFKPGTKAPYGDGKASQNIIQALV